SASHKWTCESTIVRRRACAETGCEPCAASATPAPAVLARKLRRENMSGPPLPCGRRPSSEAPSPRLATLADARSRGSRYDGVVLGTGRVKLLCAIIAVAAASDIAAAQTVPLPRPRPAPTPATHVQEAPPPFACRLRV